MKIFTKKGFVGFVAAFVFVASSVLLPIAAPAVSAQNAKINCEVDGAKNCVSAGIGKSKGTGVSETLFGSSSIFTNIVNTLLFIIGAICVIMLIWGGIRYTTSAGNSSAVTAAKNTIMYAIIGLVIAFLAYAIVNWVLAQLVVS